MIFNLFKSKPTLKELIPNGFVDIHSHILPGIDDGAKNIDESLEMISEMKNLGFSKIIATPHTYNGVYNNTNDSIKKSFKIIENANAVDIKISFASEYMLDESLIKKAEEMSILTIKDQYVLVEMSYQSPPINLYEIIFKLVLNDYKPILAHPERYRFLFNDFKQYYKLKKHGCKFQINLFSAVGFYGSDILNITEKLIKNDLVDFVGSDIHKPSQIRLFDQKVMLKSVNRFNRLIDNNIKFMAN